MSESVFVYGAPDEWLWHTELSRLNKTLQSPGLTNVYWCWGCEHADNMDGASPAAFLDHDKAVEGCTRAQNMGDFFGRKFGNGDPEGMEGVAKVSPSPSPSPNPSSDPDPNPNPSPSPDPNPNPNPSPSPPPSPGSARVQDAEGRGAG